MEDTLGKGREKVPTIAFARSHRHYGLKPDGVGWDFWSLEVLAVLTKQARYRSKSREDFIGSPSLVRKQRRAQDG